MLLTSKGVRVTYLHDVVVACAVLYFGLTISVEPDTITIAYFPEHPRANPKHFFARVGEAVTIDLIITYLFEVIPIEAN